MFNKVVFLGRLTRDVELKYLPSGSAIAVLGLASSRKYKKQDGSVAEENCFIDAKLFGRTAEIANQYLKKGSLAMVEGKLTYETWEDKNGGKRSRHTITAENLVLLDSQKQEAKKEQVSFTPSQPQQVPEIDVSDDSGGDIPF